MGIFRITKNGAVNNVLNLIISAGATALFGFVFWTILATTLLSMSALLSLLGLVGINTIFMRFLPKSKTRNEQINTGIIISGFATTLISLVFCLLTPILSSKISFVDHKLLYILMFVVVTVLTTWNTLTNAIFIAYRRTSYIVIINIAFSFIKMILPVFIHHGGPMRIFFFAGIAQLVNVLLSFVVLIKLYEFRPSLRIDPLSIKEVRKYGAFNYASSIMNLLPDSTLPLIVVNKLGATAAAYFYIAFTIANLLYTISFSTSQSLLAEASYDNKSIRYHVLHGLKINAFLLLPATVFLIVLCPLILKIFGHDYSTGASSILRIFSLCSIPMMVYSLANFVFQKTKDLKAMLITNSVNAFSIVGGAILFAHRGLDTIGWVWLFGTCFAVLASTPFLKRHLTPSVALLRVNRD
jgi:O-antigen/teichoic acid export membrane protein